MTIQEAKKWVKGFKNSASKCDYVHKGIQAIQAQIDEILMQQKTYGSNGGNNKDDIKP